MRAHLVALGLLLLSIPLAAQSTLDPVGGGIRAPQTPSSIDLSTWGTTRPSAYTISHMAFVPISSNGTYQWNGGRYSTNGDQLHAEVQLPAGASIVVLEIEACDSSPTAAFSGYLGYTTNNGLGIDVVNYTSGAVSATPGCNRFFFQIPAPHTVDNFNNAYFLEWSNFPASDGSVKIGAARVYYTLQVSPAPATATFNDVPAGHALHQFVEALTASGITAGCGGGNFCPNDPVTRGQMAVFMAKALGLHWAP